MKTKEELNALKEEVETLSKKLAELTEEELKEVTGGFGVSVQHYVPPRTSVGADENTLEMSTTQIGEEAFPAEK